MELSVDMDARASELVEMVRQEGLALGGGLSRRAFLAATGVADRELLRYFPSWGQLCALAGVSSAERVARPDDEMLRELHELFEQRGFMAMAQVEALSRSTGLATPGAYDHRFGHWLGTLIRLRQWLDEHGIAASYRADLDRRIEERERHKRRRGAVPAARRPNGSSAGVVEVEGRRWGEPLAKGLFCFDPLNEAGVAIYFGTIGERLGFRVLSASYGFPDLELLQRCSDGWQRLVVELKFASSGFKDDWIGGKRVDLVIVWRHDWPECPVAVLELPTETFHPASNGFSG